MEKSEMVSRNQRRKQKQTHQQPQIWGARLSPQTKSTTAPRTSNHRPQAYLPLPPDWPPTTPILTYHCSKTEKLMPPGWPTTTPPDWPTTTSPHWPTTTTTPRPSYNCSEAGKAPPPVRPTTTPTPRQSSRRSYMDLPPLLHQPPATPRPNTSITWLASEQLPVHLYELVGRAKDF